MNLVLFGLVGLFALPVFFAYGDTESENNLLLDKGIEQARLGEYEKAISYFDQILEKEPQHVEALFNKGNSLSRLGKYNESIPYFEKVLNLDPEKYIAVLKLENALTQISSYEFGFLDGVLEITVHDSQGGFIAYLRTSKIKAIEHEIVEDLVERWPIVNTIIQNNHTYNVHQHEFITYVEYDTIFGFHELPFSENIDFPLASTWHYQIPVERGDVVRYVYSVFRPLN